MPRLIDSQSRADSLTLAVNHVIATAGVGALTLRRIGEVSRVSPAAIISHFGSRARLLRTAAARTAEDRLDEFVIGQPRTGIRALLPTPSHRSWCDDEAVHARVWLGWLELWRADPDLERCLDDHHQTLRQYVAVLTQGLASPETISLVLALSEGLQSQMAAPVNPLSPARAHELFDSVVAAMAIPTAPHSPVPEHLAAAVNWMCRAGRGQPWREDSGLREAFSLHAPPHTHR